MDGFIKLIRIYGLTEKSTKFNNNSLRQVGLGWSRNQVRDRKNFFRASPNLQTTVGSIVVQ